MPLSDKEKTDARDALTLALELNEPETMLEGLKRLCMRKAIDAHLGDNERQRYRSSHEALDQVLSELMGADKRDKPDNGAPEPQGEQDAPDTA
jgi:hypothetical protein